ncbi:hemicentin-1 [Trichonephila clavipes]|nr:hemicentin-1 [Trichonephila clavipes]
MIVLSVLSNCPVVYKKLETDSTVEQNFKSINGTLVLHSARMMDAGEYECSADNDVTPPIAKRIRIHVNDAPKIIQFSFKENVLEGDVVSVACFAVTKMVPVTYTWLKNGKNIENVKNIRFSNTEEVSSIILDPVTLSDSGNYTCAATNSAGRDTFTTALQVKAPPRWITVPNDIVSTLGNFVSAHCIATGSPEPTIIWKKFSGTHTNTEQKSRIKTSQGEDVNRNNSVLKFDSMSYDDAGTYECEADNGISPSIRTNFTIILRASPQWLEEPKNVIIRVGESIGIHCSATGSPKPTISWKKISENTEKIIMNPSENAKHSSNHLKIISVSSSDAGVYQCIADNEIEPVIKSNFTVTIRDNIVEGDVVSVTCFAMTKTKPITFQWLKNDHELNEFQNNMRFDTGSEISALIVDPVKLTDSGNYTCATTNTDGSDRFTATLNVKASPKWIEEPDNIITIMGTSIEARCTASGSPEPQMNWKKTQDNKNVQMSYHHQWLPGKNSSILKISPVTYDHSGLYECIADNGISPSIKTNFTLSVRVICLTDPPKVKQFRFDDNIREGDVASVMCLVTSGSKPVKFQWNKNGNPISISDNNVRIDDGAIHSVLVFDSVKLTDDANYTCIAMNAEGQDSFTAELNVKSSPKWKTEPKSVVTQVGGSVKVQCIAFGSPRPSIKWRKIIPEGNEFMDVKPQVSNENEFNSGTFHLDSVSESDSGFYECIANNGIEPNIRNNFSIVIRDAPKIQSFSFPENIVERNMVSVTCIVATKTKPVTFNWLKDSKEINALEENIRFSTLDEVSVLIIDSVALENSGNYTCSASNSAGNDKFTTSLKVKASPKWIEQPLDLITTVGAAVTVKCSASGSPEPIIQWTKKDGSKSVNVNPTVSSDIKDSSLLRLSPVSYEDAGVYECMADNGIPP